MDNQLQHKHHRVSWYIEKDQLVVDNNQWHEQHCLIPIFLWELHSMFRLLLQHDFFSKIIEFHRSHCIELTHGNNRTNLTESTLVFHWRNNTFGTPIQWIWIIQTSTWSWFIFHKWHSVNCRLRHQFLKEFCWRTVSTLYWFVLLQFVDQLNGWYQRWMLHLDEIVGNHAFDWHFQERFVFVLVLPSPIDNVYYNHAWTSSNPMMNNSSLFPAKQNRQTTEQKKLNLPISIPSISFETYLNMHRVYLKKESLFSSVYI